VCGFFGRDLLNVGKHMDELIVSTPAFEHNGLIPINNTGYGVDVSPELCLNNIDKNAKSIAIIMDDMGHILQCGILVGHYR
jgi:phosphatidylethanolamine-binding protein (PEBP) family uncharacterized protein